MMSDCIQCLKNKRAGTNELCDNCKPKKTAQDLAKEHVDWFLETLRPLLMTHFLHGYKHGQEDREGDDA
jgi:hypothetical protein